MKVPPFATKLWVFSLLFYTALHVSSGSIWQITNRSSYWVTEVELLSNSVTWPFCNLSDSTWRWPAYRPKHVVQYKIIKRTRIIWLRKVVLSLSIVLVRTLSRYSAVYISDWRNSSPGKENIFFVPSRPLLGPTQPPIQRIRGGGWVITLGGIVARAWSWPLFNNTRIYTFTNPYDFMA
jgi:hypothetical protein